MALNLKFPLYLQNVQTQNSKKLKIGAQHISIVVLNSRSLKSGKTILKNFLGAWQLSKISENDSWSFETPKGPLHIITLPAVKHENITHEGMLDNSNYSLARDRVGGIFTQIELEEYKTTSIHLMDLEYDEILGSLLGLEMGSYDFQSKTNLPPLTIYFNGELPKAAIEDALESATQIGKSVNLARHLVNTPPCDKRPMDYAQAVVQLLGKKASTSIEVWDDKKLIKEKMGLISGVGQGSVQGPRMVHIKYRPKKSKLDQPIAFVGKGITYDTGGLNLKPGGSMRNMKKDMGGSAAVLGLANWVVTSKLDLDCDFYLALAENSVDAKSYRPGDILTAKNGMTVEIDNTDAEGRLALADVLTVASQKKGKDRPHYIIDVATLTGAVKVGLGDDIGGLFSNDDDLAFLLQSCSQIAGDKLWRLPLMDSQREKLKSDCADISNSTGGFGGAIRAAMFLKEFTGDIPWAHLDIYSWVNAKSGPYSKSGGNGQGVQALAQFLSQI